MARGGVRSSPPLLRLPEEFCSPSSPPPPPFVRPRRHSDRPPCCLQDPLSTLGDDLFLAGILPLLDASALACCAAVSRRWCSLSCSSCLWLPFLGPLLASRAHIPLAILRSRSPLHPYTAFSITMRDAAQVLLSPPEMCARIWEMRVKPTCGPYWHSLDPTTRGEVPLLRRFLCDHSVTPMQENDPIWGGQESVWKYFTVEIPHRNLIRQFVQINSWPHHLVSHLPDGRWRLENEFASYTTCPDQDWNRPSFLVGRAVGFCSNCNPKPTVKIPE